jgi:hypothetical protein
MIVVERKEGQVQREIVVQEPIGADSGFLLNCRWCIFKKCCKKYK